MKLFFKDIRLYIISYFVGLFITLIYILSFKGFSLSEVLYILFFNIVIISFFCIFKYVNAKKMYKYFRCEKTESKDFVQDLGNDPIAIEVQKTLRNQYDIYSYNIRLNKESYDEHLTFINQWVHQMKTPLSVLKLKNEDIKNRNFVSIDEEIGRLNRGLDMAMYYARIDSFSKDFVVNKLKLIDVIRESVNSEKQMFIKNNIFPKLQIDDDIEVLTDKKWLLFVVGQIITNGVKYSKGIGKTIEISAIESQNLIKLSIKDQGIGIPKKDIERVFEPFFTGENGRKYGESTGMGLYISRKICESLNHKISVYSKVSEGTCITISFRKVTNM